MAELGERRPEGGDAWSSWRRHPSGWRSRAWCVAIVPDLSAGTRGASLRGTCLPRPDGRSTWFDRRHAVPRSSPAPPPGSATSSPSSSPPAGTTWCSSPATGAPGVGRRASSGRRTASRPRCWPPTSPTASQLARVEERVADRDAAGRPAGEQRRLRPQGPLPRQRRRPGAGMLDVLVTAVLRLTHAALRADDRARQRRDHQRLQRRGVPAPRHLQRREGLGEQLQRLGAPRVRRPWRHRDGALPRLHEDGVPRAHGGHGAPPASCGWRPTSWSARRSRTSTRARRCRSRASATRRSPGWPASRRPRCCSAPRASGGR